ncbi:hypothetical protein CAEBREN_15051 [Caenorhabditis brenneri]|uniref:DUF7038 domain-containing protein n=1 Tax=Caenorhabditis brenneri TaxID=135651 RepID=G0N6T8_CAEBE|nr:hypothetical protein CAEBREN_15051 [Caenorhabditis brenneri]
MNRISVLVCEVVEEENTFIHKGGVDDLQSGFDLEVIDGVVHIKTIVFCFKKECLKDGQENFGDLPFSRELGRVRDPQGRLKKSFKEGRQHTVIVRYAPVAGEPEVFEIADVFDFVNGKEKLPPPENRNDEDDKENDKKKKPAKKGKAGKAARRRAQRIP